MMRKVFYKLTDVCDVCPRPAPVSEGATSIQLPVRECHIREGTNCTMYGWGETKSTETSLTLALQLVLNASLYRLVVSREVISNATQRRACRRVCVESQNACRKLEPTQKTLNSSAVQTSTSLHQKTYWFPTFGFPFFLR